MGSVLPIEVDPNPVIEQMTYYIGEVHSGEYLKLVEKVEPFNNRIYSALSLCDHFLQQFSMLQLGVDSFYEEVKKNYDRLTTTISSINLTPVQEIRGDAAVAARSITAPEPTGTRPAVLEGANSSPTISSQSQQSSKQSTWSSFRAELDAIFRNLLEVKLNYIQ